MDSLPTRRVSAYFWASLETFSCVDSAAVLGSLSSSNAFDLDPLQRDAWEDEVRILKTALAGLSGTIFLEFDVPRLGSRIDAVAIIGAAVIPIEFKCGDATFLTSHYNQAWDYALDLKNFHQASHAAPVFPILVATAATSGDRSWLPPHPDGVRPPRRCSPATLRSSIEEAVADSPGEPLDGVAWGTAAYQPTPTIIEAARALYANHTVEAISRNDAGAINLTVTAGAVEEVIERSRANGEKAIVFLTGVPGAGKTLVGLDVATRRREKGDARAVFLSGNGPLVAVLQEALTRDEMARRGSGVRKGVILQAVKPFIQNVHHFRDEGVRNPAAPYDHVVIFDEAQRAWDRQKAADFMKRRKKVLNFNQSEPEFLISYLDRHEGWAVIVCLVGGGQEIHTGEAGIGAWLDAVRNGFGAWRVHVSPDMVGSEYAAATSLDAFGDDPRIFSDRRLHLTTSMRSFRSEHVSAFVKALLDSDVNAARTLSREILRKYPMAVTRDHSRAKTWIREHARGSERFGMVASSQAQRLKPHAIDVRVNVDPVHYFLNERHDTRSSYYLEDAATEFQIQGLELDWICVNWDADLRRVKDGWGYHSFRGARWENVKKSDRRRYLLNAYRVLLTRARQGMVIFVPPGDDADPTRDPAFYDQTYDYLAALGLPPA